MKLIDELVKYFPQKYKSVFNPTNNGTIICPSCKSLIQKNDYTYDHIIFQCIVCNICLSYFAQSSNRDYILYFSGIVNPYIDRRFILNSGLFGPKGKEIPFQLDLANWNKTLAQIEMLEFYL